MLESDNYNWSLNSSPEGFVSPNGKIRAIYSSLCSIDGSNIESGICYLIHNNHRIPIGNAISGPPIWSNDSRFLALPRKVNDFLGRNTFRILVVDCVKMMIAEDFEDYRLIVFESFRNNIIKGIDSPNYRPLEILINVEKLEFKDFKVIDWSDYTI